MDKALIMGEVFVDVIINVPQLPDSGGDVLGDLQATNIGGSAFNTFGAIQYAQGAADLFVPVGEGTYADIIQNEFKRLNITSPLLINGDDNGWDICLVEPNGERSFLTISGIDSQVQKEWFTKINLADYQYFYLSGYQVESESNATLILNELEKRRTNSWIIFDASPRIKYLKKATLNLVLNTANLLIHCNQDEIEFLAGFKGTIQEMATALFNSTQSPIIVTLGSQGTYFITKNDSGIIPAEEVEVLNTIGAGDTHCGGMLHALCNGASLRLAIEYANHLAAIVVAQESGNLLLN